MAKANGYASIPEEIKNEYYSMAREINLPDARYGEEYDYQLPMIGKYTAYGTTCGIKVRVPAGLKISLDGRITGSPLCQGTYEEEIRLFRFLKAARARTKMEVMRNVTLKIRVNPSA